MKMAQLCLQQLQPRQREAVTDNSNYAFFKLSWNIMAEFVLVENYLQHFHRIEKTNSQRENIPVSSM